MKSPAFQFYPRDFLVGTAMMTANEVGAYIRLLCYQWDHDGIPNDDKTLARIAGVNLKTITSVRNKFDISDGKTLRNSRMESVRAEQQSYRDKQAELANRRWNKPAKPDAKALPPHVPGHVPSDMPEAMPNGMPNACSAPAPAPAPAIPIILAVDKPPRKRNELMDELASIAGIPLAEIGESVAKRLNKVIATIKQSTPDVTPAEIKKRSDNYRTHFSGVPCTPEALGKHWSACHEPSDRRENTGQKQMNWAK